MSYILGGIAIFMVFTLWCFLRVASRVDNMELKKNK